MNEIVKPGLPRTVIPAEQIQKRVREMGRQISDDYRGQSIHLLALLENGFIFMADLVRALEVPVICQFIKPKYHVHRGRWAGRGAGDFLQPRTRYSRPACAGGRGLVHSGITTEFLMSDLKARGAASVKLATLLDRQSARRVQLQPDYFGFLVDEAFLVGYGLGSPEQTNRNLPYVGAAS